MFIIYGDIGSATTHFSRAPEQIANCSVSYTMGNCEINMYLHDWLYKQVCMQHLTGNSVCISNEYSYSRDVCAVVAPLIHCATIVNILMLLVTVTTQEN
jgi:hypothetical protein